MNQKIEKPKILFVEGKDDQFFFESLLDFLKIQDVQLLNVGGKDNFRNSVSLSLKQISKNKVTHIGMIRDAEGNPAQSAFDSLQSLLKALNYPYPLKLNEIKNENNLKVGIFILPNNEETGMLEDLCLSSIQGEPAIECINGYIECIKNLGLNFNEPKSKILCYLASKPSIRNTSLGVAAKNSYWNFSHSAFEELKNFLSLFKD